MKILKPGRNTETNLFKCTCEFCECVFQFTRNEADWYHEQRCDGDNWRIKCPQCGTLNVGAL